MVFAPVTTYVSGSTFPVANHRSKARQGQVFRSPRAALYRQHVLKSSFTHKWSQDFLYECKDAWQLPEEARPQTPNQKYVCSWRAAWLIKLEPTNALNAHIPLIIPIGSALETGEGPRSRSRPTELQAQSLTGTLGEKKSCTRLRISNHSCLHVNKEETLS